MAVSDTERPRWERYVKDMSPFYFSLLSEYMNAIASHQYDFEYEDVIVMKDLSHLFKLRDLEVAVKQSQTLNLD